MKHILFLLIFIFSNLLYGAPELKLKAHGGVLQFTNGKINLGQDLSYGSFSFEAWINTNSSTYFGIISFDDLVNNTEAGYIGVYNGKLNVVSAEGVTDVYSTSDINDTTWHHIAVTYDDTDSNLSIYVDNTLEYNAINDIVTTGGIVTLGDNTNNGNTLLDDIRLWDFARTASEINATMNQQLYGNETGLIAYYNFDERIGNTVYDITSNNYDGIIEGNVTRLNFLGDTLSFDGVSDSISVSTQLNTLSYTKALWFKAPTNVTGNLISTQGSGHFFWFAGGSKIGAAHNGTTTSGTTGLLSVNDYNDNQWHFATLTYDSNTTTMKLYIDGVLDIENTGVTIAPTDTSIEIGSSNGGSGSFNGLMSQVSIWNKALNQTQIKQIMYSTPDITDSSLTGYWALNEGTGTTAYDRAQNINNGTITGTTWIDTAPTIYGDKIYSTIGVVAETKLLANYFTNSITGYTVDNNVSAPVELNSNIITYFPDNNIPDTLLFYATDGIDTANLLVNFISYDSSSLKLNLNLSNINLNDFNITSIRAYTPDSQTEDLFVYDYYGRGGSNTIVDLSDNNYSVPIYYPDNNFSIEVNGTFTAGAGQSSWYYNFNDNKLYPDINSTTDFKTEISVINNSFLINPSIREYYTFTGNISNNDHNVTNIVLMSNSINLGWWGNITGTTYTVNYSELGNHYILLILDNNSSKQYYYNVTNGDINSSYINSTLDTTSTTFLDLNLSSAHFDNYTSSSTTDITPPTISQIYDRFRLKSSSPSTFVIPFHIDDNSGGLLNLSITPASGTYITYSVQPNTGTIPSNSDVNITITPIANQVGIENINVIVSDSSNNWRDEHFSVILDSQQYNDISAKETQAIYNTVATLNIDVTDDRYSLHTYRDFQTSAQIVEYDRITINSNSVLEEHKIIDSNGFIVSSSLEPASFQENLEFNTTLDNVATSQIFSDNHTPFTFNDTNSSSQKVFIKYLNEELKVEDYYYQDNQVSYNNMNDFIEYLKLNQTSYGLMRNKDHSKILSISTTSGILEERDENQTIINLNAGSWSTATVNGYETLIINPTSSDYHQDMALVLVGGYVKYAQYHPANSYYSYLMLNKEAKNELYHSISSNPKYVLGLNNGYTYISLRSPKTICDASVQSTYSFCDQANTLNDIFGINPNITHIFKYGNSWEYWDETNTTNVAYQISKLSTINPKDGVLVKTSASTTILLPFDEDSELVNDYKYLFSSGWTLMSNQKTQSVAQISDSLIAQGKELVYILLLRNDIWYVYAPTNDSSINSSINRLTEVKRYESYWVYFR